MDAWTRGGLSAHLRALGLAESDAVMVHAGLRAVGPMEARGVTLVEAILDTIDPGGTLLAYTDWIGGYEHLLDDAGHLPDALKAGVTPFDPATSPATPDNGAFVEIVRRWPGAMRSGSPGPSVAAVGAKATWFTADHALNYGYGERSPFAKLVEARGKVLMVGAPLDTMTLLHHAEHKADIPEKRVIRVEVPLFRDGHTEWRMIEEFDTSNPVVSGVADDYFAEIVEAFLATGQGCRGKIGKADSVLVPAREIVEFAVRWLEARFPIPVGNGNRP